MTTLLLERPAGGIDVAPPRGGSPAIRVTRRFAAEPARVEVIIEARHRGCTLSLAQVGVPRARSADTRNRWAGILYGLRGLLAD